MFTKQNFKKFQILSPLEVIPIFPTLKKFPDQDFMMYFKIIYFQKPFIIAFYRHQNHIRSKCFQKILTFKVNTYFDLVSDTIWLNYADYDVIIT